ncbi:MAG: hypothetical protein ACE5HO_20930 [bacterium]
MKTMKALLWTSFLLGLFFLQGCVVFRFVETRVTLSPDNSPAKMVITYDDLSSDEDEIQDVRKDFEELLKGWHGDKYLVERADEGVLVQDREVYIEDGKIMARESGILKDLNDTYAFWVSNGERLMMFDDSGGDYELVESNGQVLKTKENTLIVWPDDAKELYWKQRLTEDSESFEKNRPLMVKWLKEYLASQAKTAEAQD